MAVGGAGGGGGGGGGGAGRRRWWRRRWRWRWRRGAAAAAAARQTWRCRPTWRRRAASSAAGPARRALPAATAIRVHWVNSGGTATVSYDAFGMPDHAREKVGSYGTGLHRQLHARVRRHRLAAGGLLLDGGDFIDIELSGGSIARSPRDAGAVRTQLRHHHAGSFSWLSFSDSGETDTDFVSNAPPYHWYKADIANTVEAGDAGVLVRVSSGRSPTPSSSTASKSA